MPKIEVFPTHENAFALSHPIDGRISDQGSMWEHDGFTARMLADNAVTTDEDRRHYFDQKHPDPRKPPAHATESGASAHNVEKN